MIVNTDMVFTHGMMGNNMKDGGKMVNSTVKVFTEKMDVIAEVSGKTERELNGSMMSNGPI